MLIPLLLLGDCETDTMARIVLPKQLRHIAPLEHAVSGAATVRDALILVFERYPQVRDYILDEQCILRRRVAVFLNGRPVLDPEQLGDPLNGRSCIHVLPALAERAVP